MIIRSKKGQRKTDCSNCGHPIEPELVAKKQAYCRACKSEYMANWHSQKKGLIEKALEFYKLHNGQ